MRRASPDPVARLAREFLLLAALLAAPWREFASRGFQNPMMNAIPHQLKRLSFGHEKSPLDIAVVVP